MATAFRTLARAALCAVTLCSFARADVPRTIAFQGSLKDTAGTPLSGSRQVTFSLYDTATEGTPLWTETQTVTLTNGLFAVPLGSVTPLNLPFDKPYWVGIKVGDDAEMSPRVPLTSAPYALSLPGMVADTNGNIGIGTPSPITRLQVKGNAGLLSLEGTDHAYINWYPLGYLPGTPGAGRQAWMGFGGADNNSFFVATENDGGDVILLPKNNVGIGTGNPRAKLHVIGKTYIDPTDWGEDPTLTLAVGDSDTGINWDRDGTISLAANGIASARITPHRVFIDPDAFGPGDPTITMAIGDSDTGINWAGDGALDIYANNQRTMLIREHELHVDGRAYANLLTLTSSRRFKRDVQPLANALSTLSQLQGVSYVWDEQHGGKPDIGFIAEDAGKVVPELVTWEPNGVDAVGMDYSHLTALTVEGIKEQQKEIESLRAENADLKARLERLEALVAGGGPR